MPDVVLSGRGSIGVIGVAGAVNVSRVWDGRNRTVWDLSPENARATAAAIAAEAAMIDGRAVPTTEPWVACMAVRDGTDPVEVALFSTMEDGLAHLACRCREGVVGLPADDREALERFFELNTGEWSVSRIAMAPPTGLFRPGAMGGMDNGGCGPDTGR